MDSLVRTSRVCVKTPQQRRARRAPSSRFDGGLIQAQAKQICRAIGRRRGGRLACIGRRREGSALAPFARVGEKIVEGTRLRERGGGAGGGGILQRERERARERASERERAAERRQKRGVTEHGHARTPALRHQQRTWFLAPTARSVEGCRGRAPMAPSAVQCLHDCVRGRRMAGRPRT